MDKAARAALLTAKRKDNKSENIADYVAELLRQGRASEVTDDLMAQADPQRLHHHYTSGNTGMDLPMDYASRMERAAKMGFQNKSYHGTSQKFPHFSLDAPSATRVKSRAVFSTDNPDVASGYGHSVMPIMTKADVPISFDFSGRSRTHFNNNEYTPSQLANEIRQTRDDARRYGSEVETDKAYDLENAGAEPMYADEIDAVHMKNINDTNDMFNGQIANHTATLDPTNIRSQFARFDPRLEHLAHLSASTGGAMGKGDEFETSSQDASHIFGNGAVYRWYRHPKSGGYIQILQRPNVPASVIGLEVPEEFRGQGIGQALQAEAMRNHPSLMGQVSSKAAAKTAYRLGRRPYGNPNASLDDVFNGIDQDSSINLMTPEAQPKLKSTGGAMEFARHVEAIHRAGGQIAPSKYLPDVPRAVHAGGGDVGDDEDGITAYHGSPHSFEKFDIGKIGTGEGNQSYGHGLYFAGNEKVAKGYRNALSDTLIHPEGTPDLEKRAGQMALTFSDNTPEGAVKWLSKFKNGATHTSPAMTPELVEAVSKRFSSGEFRPGGHMYKVKISAKPEELLDWDKPLSEQSPNIQRIAREADISKAIGRTHGILQAWREGRDVGVEATGHDLHKALSNYGENGKQAADYLQSQGIKGIRYRDAGSRDLSDGDPTHNYVMFHHDPIKVMSKYEYGGTVDRALALTRRFTKDGNAATASLKKKPL